MKRNKIVLDTNCLLASISSKSENFHVWTGFQQGKFVLCVSNEILEEYNEIISKKASSIVAENIINAIVESGFVEFVDPRYHFELITSDIDDNKFVDCAIATNAAFIVSEDKHFDVLKEIPFPKLLVIRLKEFLKILTEQEALT